MVRQIEKGPFEDRETCVAAGDGNRQLNAARKCLTHVLLSTFIYILPGNATHTHCWVVGHNVTA